MPVAFSGPAAEVVELGRGRPVEVAAGVIERLRSICAEVDDSEAGRRAAATDWWPLNLHLAAANQVVRRPALVARPGSAAEVGQVLRICSEERIPVTPAGGRSGVCGGAMPLHGGVALDLTRLSGIDSADSRALLVTAGAGTFGDDLEASLRAGYGLTCGHRPQSIALSTVGGWVACRGAGQFSTRYGKIEDIVAGLEVVLASGEALALDEQPRAAAGPSLLQLFTGSEGTLGVITSVTLRARPAPAPTRSSAFVFPGFGAGIEAVRRILRRGATPAVVRLYDQAESARHFPDLPGAVLLLMDEGDPVMVEAVMRVAAAECAAGDATPAGEAPVADWFEHRDDVSLLAPLIKAGLVVDTMEVAASWPTLERVYGAVRDAVTAVPGALGCTAHLSHAYPDGAGLYFTLLGRPEATGPEAVAVFTLRLWAAAQLAAIEAGARLSHHHGIGLLRARWLPAGLGPAHHALAAVKATFDPHGILNPGKLGLPDPYGDPGWF